MSDLIERLEEFSGLPSAYEHVGDDIEILFDPGLRHKPGKNPFDYLNQWLSMLRPFAYATRDDSWGEMEKLLCIIMRNYVRMMRLCPEAAARIRELEEGLRRLASPKRINPDIISFGHDDELHQRRNFAEALLSGGSQ